MHKLVRKRVGFLTFLLLLLSICFTNTEVLAADKDEGKCRSDIVNKISIDYDGFSVDTGKAMKITVTVPNKGSYQVQYHEVAYGEDAKDIDDSADVVVENVSGTTWTHNLAEGKEIFVFVTLKSNLAIGGDTCHAAGTVRINSKGTIINKKSTWKSESIQNPPTSNVGNPIYETNACQLMREGKYENNGTAHKNDIVYHGKTENHDYDLGKWNLYATKYFPYCYNPASTMGFALSQKNINYVRKELLKIYHQKEEIKIGGITPTPGFNTKVDSTDVGELSCLVKPEKDSFGKYKDNSKKYYYEESEDVENKSTGENVCTVTCREELEVIYSPPVAVKAGLCFQYEVTVKSKVQCKTELNKDAEPKPPSNSLGAPVAICSGGSDQAGPNDDFDDCIRDCDGGEYSQECINKCYNKVYRKKPSSKSTNQNVRDMNVFNEENHTVFLANKDDDYVSYDIPGCKTNEQIYENRECYKKLTEAKQQDPLGSYKSGNSQYEKANLHWVPDNKDWNGNNQNNYNCRTQTNEKSCAAESYIKSIKRAAPYYFRSVDATADLIKGLHGYYSGRYYKRYIIDNNGIKRQYSSRYQCGEKCGFKGKKGSIYNNKEAKEAYEKSLKGYADALTLCNAAAKCSTDEATFTIDVTNGLDKNNDGECDSTNTCGTDGEKCDWKATNNKNVQGGSPRGDILIFTPAKGDIKDVQNGINGICYGHAMPWQHYKTTITFPGSWINLKTGEVQYADQKKEDEYRKKPNYFCTPYDSCNVNEDWWKWDFYGSALADDYKPDAWNIGSTVKTFGKYNWNLNISCFYALYNETCEGDECLQQQCYRGDEGSAENCGDTKEGNKKESTKLNYDIRVASLDSLFPKNRLRGYNWGSSAKLASNDKTVQSKLKAGGYDIDPVEYSKAIMKNSTISGKGEEGTYQERELDFRITLSDKDVAYLKNLNLELDGTYNKSKEIIPGLYAYTMDKKITNHFGTNISRKWEIGTNNK